MKGLWPLLSRVKYYKKSFTLSIISNILLSIFTVISIPLLIPFFQMLFDRVENSPVKPTTNEVNAWVEYYIGTLINNYGKEQTLMFVCIILIIVFFLKNLFRYAALYFIAPMRYGIIYDLRKNLYEKFLHLPLSFYTEERKGVLLSSMTTDVQEIEWSILNVIEAVFKSPIIMIGSIFFMLYISPSLTLFVFVLVLIAGVLIGRVVSNLKQESVNVQETIANMTATVDETLGGIRIIKGFRAEEYHKGKFELQNKQFRDILTKVVNRRDLASPISEFLGITVVTILMWYGSNLVFDNNLAPETFFAFVFAFYQVIEPAKSFSNAYFNIQKGMAAIERIDRILDTDTEIINKAAPIKKNGFTTSIELKNVTYAYKNAEKSALQNVSFTIKKGQSLALVGSSGAGKSTIVDLLPRFYDVTQGNIFIDGIDIMDLDLNDVRGLFGIVSQDAILFHDTIANNILFGGNNTMEEVIEASKIANAHDFISVLPQGYNTNIGDRGVKLSGGQRQRITIARAILKNPPILILDEATSALDSESESLVQEALTNIMQNRTSVIVAHRLSTVKDADMIIVLEDGKVIEEGNHESLMGLNKAYKKFVDRQSFNEK